MASSKVVASSTSKNPDRRRKSSNTKSSISDLHNNHAQIKIDVIGRNNLSTTVDGLLRNLYGGVKEATAVSTLLDADITLHDAAGAVTPISDNEGNSSRGMPIISRQESSNFSDVGRKTVQDILKEIAAGRSERRECKQEAPDEFMTLEDFLTKADAMEEEDVKIEPLPLATERLSGGIFTFDSLPMTADGAIGFGSGEVNGVRGKRRASFEPLDKASQQRQRRMIKNRESAARSRERKQAYQVELESLAVKLEEENEILLKEKDEQTRKRLKQLMEKIIPVVEKRKPARALRRSCSMEW